MTDKDQITLVEIRERLVKIETILEQQDYKQVCKVADEAKSMAENNAESIAKLQSANTWIVRTIIGAILAAALSFILVK